MELFKTSLEGLVIIETKRFDDNRGWFRETYRQDKLIEFLGYSINFVQDNQSNSDKGVLRGLHYQLDPMAQSKLVSVSSGRILDVVVDIRKDSDTFGQYESVELSAESGKQLFIPTGFAHGFLSREDGTVVNYKVDNYYSPEHERGINYADNELSIDWHWDVDKLIMSDKDKDLPKLANAQFA